MKLVRASYSLILFSISSFTFFNWDYFELKSSKLELGPRYAKNRISLNDSVENSKIHKARSMTERAKT